jgi:phytoene synthase
MSDSMNDVVAHRDHHPPHLQAAYETCRRMQRRHDPTFYWATRRLPADVRPAVHALYGFVRGADEIVDGRGKAGDPALRRAQLDAWDAALQEGRRTGRSEHPVIAALVDAGERHRLPLEELGVYMDSMRIDCGPVRIASREELDTYMNGSAASVGRLMAPLLGAPSEQETVAALGVAFQLTNFIRDVREDWAMDRVYLPGLDEGDLSQTPASARLRERVAGEVARARALFAEGGAVLDAVTPAVRPGMRLALTVYARVLDRVERIGFDVLGRRAALAPWELAGAVARGARA